MPQITVAELWTLAEKALQGQGFESAAAKEIAEEFVVAELTGTKTHGLGKLVSLNLGDLNAKPDIRGDGAWMSVDGRGGNGFLLFREIAKSVASRCTTHGICVALVHNFSRYSSLYPYTSRVSRSGHLAILSNSAGPAAVTPYGSIDPITGTNPICFSFPKVRDGVQTFDFATSEVVWGAIRQSALENVPLPYGAFLNAAGEVASSPSDVNSVKAFGGKKGSALNLALEILAGILPGGKAGLECETEFDCGAIFIALNPAAIGPGQQEFEGAVERLLDSIRASRPEEAFEQVRVPGDRGRNAVSLETEALKSLDIPQSVLDMLRRMGDGESVAELASNPLYN